MVLFTYSVIIKYKSTIILSAELQIDTTKKSEFGSYLITSFIDDNNNNLLTSDNYYLSINTITGNAIEFTANETYIYTNIVELNGLDTYNIQYDTNNNYSNIIKSLTTEIKYPVELIFNLKNVYLNKGTQILCLDNNNKYDINIPIENLSKCIVVKTLKHNYQNIIRLYSFKMNEYILYKLELENTTNLYKIWADDILINIIN